MNDDKELKARLEECEKDLLFWLHYRSRLSKTSRNMGVIADKEIERLTEVIKELSRCIYG